jgi:hypothetical protein
MRALKTPAPNPLTEHRFRLTAAVSNTNNSLGAQDNQF